MTDETLMTAAEPTESASSTTASPANASTDAPATGEQQPDPTGSTPPAEDTPATSGEEIVYDFKFGEDVQVDPTSLADLKSLATDLKLPLEQAQKIADLGARQAQRWAEAQEKAIQDATVQWIEQVKSDKELGGDKFAANLATAKAALNQFGTPELTALLNDSRLGNHPEMVRFMHRVGKALGDDTVVPGGRSTNRPSDPAKRLYDNSNLS